MRRFRRSPVPSRNVRQRNPSEIGGEVGARHKLLVYWFLCRQIQPIPAPLEPRESCCGIASARLIIDRDVSRSCAADLLRSSERCPGDQERVERVTPRCLRHQHVSLRHTACQVANERRNLP